MGVHPGATLHRRFVIHLTNHAPPDAHERPSSTSAASCTSTQTKQSVEVHDYVDTRVPLLDPMQHQRLAAFEIPGFDTPRRSRRPKTYDRYS